MDKNEKKDELDWARLREDMDSVTVKYETLKERLIRKFKATPLVPIGCLATVCALSFGLRAFKRGDRKMSQMMMRARVIAQGFTIIVATIATVTAVNKAKQKNESLKEQ